LAAVGWGREGGREKERRKRSEDVRHTSCERAFNEIMEAAATI
jgi:hypothetical protein